MAKGKNPGTTTLADLQYAMTGESAPADTPTYIPTPAGHVPSVATPQHEHVVFKLVNTKKKGKVHIDGIDDVINPQTGKLERIILLTGAPTIWAKDMVELLKDKDYVRRNRRSLTFEGGVLRVPAWDTQTLEWIDHCRHCIDNPSRRSGSKYEFFRYDAQKIAKAAMDREMLELDMAIAARDMADAQVRKLAVYFGIAFMDEIGRPKTPEALRRDLMLRAKKDPVRFQQAIGSREVEIAYLVQQAILDTHIDITGVAGSARWAATGGFIARIPLSRKPKDVLVELALSPTEEGRAFLDQLQTLIR